MSHNKNITGSGKKLGVYRMPNKVENIRKSTESSKILQEAKKLKKE